MTCIALRRSRRHDDMMFGEPTAAITRWRVAAAGNRHPGSWRHATMRRVVSVFLPSWPTDRLRRLPGSVMPPQDRPLMTAMHDGRRQAVAAVDRAARALGLFPGMPLAQGQAMVPAVTVVPAEPEAEARALDDLAAWCLRYAPLIAPDQPDGIWVDATGSAHLFGGESELLDDMIERLARGGITAWAAIADTPGSAWAIARHAPTSATVVPSGETAPSLRGLPITALRLSQDIASGRPTGQSALPANGGAMSASGWLPATIGKSKTRKVAGFGCSAAVMPSTSQPVTWAGSCTGFSDLRLPSDP
jgi:hypothetical protein